MVERENREDLLLKYYEGSTTEEETVQVEDWMKATEENRTIARQVRNIALAADMAEIQPQLDVEEALESVHQKMMSGKTINRYRLLTRGMQRAAAILFLPLLLSWCLLYFGRDDRGTEMMEVKTNPGMIASVVLPDSTVVVLNSSSSLQYPSRFSGEKREVKLVGEAFFSVKKDADRKFVVNTLNGAEIKVYGTEFNVEAYEEDKKVQTTLVSGKVSFTCMEKGRKGSLMMQPGQKVVYDVEKQQVVLKKANVEVETSWKDGCLIFRDTPFEDILKSLSKRYNVQFIVKDERLKKNSFTGTFVRQRLERILERFRISSNIKFRFVENGDAEEEKQIIEVYY